MMIRDYIRQQLVGNQLHAQCDCIVGIDVTGVVVDVTFEHNGIALHIRDNATQRIVKLYDNHPNLRITKI